MLDREIFPFVQVFDREEKENTVFLEILNILGQRLPKSCFIYNAVKISPRFPHHTKIYFMNPDENDKIRNDSWVILTHFTEDHGQNILISTPHQEAPYSPQEKENLIRILQPSKIFDWDTPHWFIGLEAYLGRLVTEISVEVKGQVIEIQPDTLVYMEKDEEALLNQLEFELNQAAQNHPNLEIKRLDPTHGTEFIANTWKYAKPDITSLSVGRFVQLNESGGVYLTGSKVPVSGIIVHGFGLLSMLYTSEEQRGKGLAKLGIKLASVEMLKSGLFPASSIQSLNKASLNTHEKIGFKNAGSVQWIVYAPHL